MGIFNSLKKILGAEDALNMPKAIRDLQNNPLFDVVLTIARKGNEGRNYSWEAYSFKNIEEYEQIKNWEEDKKKAFIEFLIQYIIAFQDWKDKVGYENVIDTHRIQMVSKELLMAMFRLKVDYSFKDLMHYLELFKSAAGYNIFSWPVHFVLMQVEKLAKSNALTIEHVSELDVFLEWKGFKDAYADELKKLNKRVLNIKFLIAGETGAYIPFSFDAVDAFGKEVNTYLETIDQNDRKILDEIFRMAISATQSKPSKKYTDKTKELIDSLKIKKYKEFIQPILEYFVALKPIETVHERGSYSYSTWEFLAGNNPVTLKGLVWTFQHFHDAQSIDLIGRVASRAFKKIPGVGPSAAGIGNACIYSLASSRGLDGVAQLSRLKLVVTQNNAKKLIDKYLVEISKKLGITTEEIEDMSCPSFGLTEGRKVVDFKDYQLEIEIIGLSKVQQVWRKPDGSTQKTAPSFIKESKTLSDKFKKAKAEIKNISKMVSTQKDRLDRSMVLNRKYTWEYFQKYYLHHGLMQFVCKDLIWHFSYRDRNDAGIYREGSFWNLKDEKIDWIDEGTEVRLWHPIYESTETIQAWREKFINLEIKQLMKQVFREVYLLTDAEINTGQYSNRMASHILKQHQFNALAGVRGWKYQLLGAYDDGRDGEVATKFLHALEMRAEFWIIELNTDDGYNDAGIWNYVSTDQVRFIKDSGETIDLVDVPKVVLSEVLRDVDLFVGVTSVGNDPQWMDNGGEVQYRNYWESYSFGDLSEVAKTRKSVLETLVPRLKIKDKAQIKDKWLIVEGKLRTYKIHLGSTNILMEPNDQYLCIVPSSKKDTKAEKVFLPFEGDKGLSVIISKALMLAEDDKITDSTITSQINRR